MEHVSEDAPAWESSLSAFGSKDVGIDFNRACQKPTPRSINTAWKQDVLKRVAIKRLTPESKPRTHKL